MNEPNQPQSTPDLRRLTKKNLTTNMVRSLDRFFRPGPFQLQGMIQSICQRKKWSRSFLSAVLCITDGDLKAWEYGKKKPPGCAVRLIWLLHVMDTAPELAFSILHYATYGEIEKRPAQIVHGPSAEDKDRIIAALVACKESKYRITPWRRSLAFLAKKYNVGAETMRRYCKECGYNPVDGRKPYYKKKQQLRILKPGSPWMKADWRLKDREIAAQVLASEKMVYINRSKLRKLPKATLKRHLLACGCDLAKWESILRWRKTIQKKIISSLDAPKILSQDASNETRNLDLQAQENQTGPSADVCSEQEERHVSKPEEEVRREIEGDQSRA